MWWWLGFYEGGGEESGQIRFFFFSFLFCIRLSFTYWLRQNRCLANPLHYYYLPTHHVFIHASSSSSSSAALEINHSGWLRDSWAPSLQYLMSVGLRVYICMLFLLGNFAWMFGQIDRELASCQSFKSQTRARACQAQAKNDMELICVYMHLTRAVIRKRDTQMVTSGYPNALINRL